MNTMLAQVASFLEPDPDSREAEARDRFGDAWVDRYFRDVLGMNVHAARCECLMPMTCEQRDRSDETRLVDDAFLVAEAQSLEAASDWTLRADRALGGSS